MSLSREDILRELELLPVWRLRAPLAGEGACATTPLAQPVIQIKKADEVIAQATSSASQATNNHILICSSDKKWAFIMPARPDLSASQAALFNNILQALKIEKTNQTALVSTADIEAKVIIALGETLAQALLNTHDSLEQLRGKPHLLHNIPLIVTYHPNDCLQHLPNKAKTWDDLCVALSIMNA